MQTVGFVGVGKIGLPISRELDQERLSRARLSPRLARRIREGRRRAGAARRPISARRPTSCSPACRRSEALNEVVNGPERSHTVRTPGQIIVELGSHPVPVKQEHVAPLAAEGRGLHRRRGERHTRHGGGPQGRDLSRRRCRSVQEAEPWSRASPTSCLYLGAFGSATKVKLVNNILVAINIAATAEAMALGMKAGVDLDLMIKAIANGSGGSTQFGIRAPWMAERRFKPAQGRRRALRIISARSKTRRRGGIATPLFDRAIEVYQRCMRLGFGESATAPPWST